MLRVVQCRQCLMDGYFAELWQNSIVSAANYLHCLEHLGIFRSIVQCILRAEQFD